jgi:protein gp37
MHWRRPRRVFVNSMSDWLHEEVPDTFIAAMWEVMVRTPQHTYMLLTKRQRRLPH